MPNLVEICNFYSYSKKNNLVTFPQDTRCICSILQLLMTFLPLISVTSWVLLSAFHVIMPVLFYIFVCLSFCRFAGCISMKNEKALGGDANTARWLY